MIIGGINLLSLAVAGLSAGYAMAFVGYWMEGFLNLPRIDLADQGLIYLDVDEDTPARWWVGMVTHEINSVIFALIYAALLYSLLPGPGWLRGLIFGALLWLATSVAGMVGKIGGGRLFQAMPVGALHILANLWLHVVYGLILGALYLHL